MAFDFTTIAGPLSADEPCGPDLDAQGDPAFAQFVARADGLFPASFFKRDDEGRLTPFDRSEIDFAAELRTLEKLLGESRDLRLLTIHARLSALNRDLAGVAGSIVAISVLLRDRWDDVPPKGEGGDYGFRTVVLQALDDNPTLVLPLQYIPIVQSRRGGPITLRNVLVATGEATARDGEASIDRGTLDRALAEAELDDLKGTSARLQALSAALALIEAATTEKGGPESAPGLEKLPPLVAKMLAFVDGGIASRDPTSAQALARGAPEPAAEGDPAAEGGDGAPARSTLPAGAIATKAAAGQALAAVLAYFRRAEPSSPALLLVRQAQAVMGKGFPDIVRLLLPKEADDAKIQIGADKLFGLTFDQFAAGEAAAAEAGEEAAAEPEAPEAAPADPIAAASRADALALLEQVGTFYRRAEPSSPIPLFTDRARSMIERDFLSILKDVLPSIVPEP